MVLYVFFRCFSLLLRTYARLAVCSKYSATALALYRGTFYELFLVNYSRRALCNRYYTSALGNSQQLF